MYYHRLSFPSGHSAYSIYAGVFTIVRITQNEIILITVEPLIKDPPRKRQPLYKGLQFPYLQMCTCDTFSASERGQPLYKGQNGWSQSVLSRRSYCMIQIIMCCSNLYMPVIFLKFFILTAIPLHHSLAYSTVSFPIANNGRSIINICLDICVKDC